MMRILFATLLMLLTFAFSTNRVSFAAVCQLSGNNTVLGKCNASGGCASGQVCQLNWLGSAAECAASATCCSTDASCNPAGGDTKMCDLVSGSCITRSTTIYKKIGELCTPGVTTCCQDVLQTERGATCIGTSLCPIGLPANVTVCSSCLPDGADTAVASQCCSKNLKRVGTSTLCGPATDCIYDFQSCDPGAKPCCNVGNPTNPSTCKDRNGTGNSYECIPNNYIPPSCLTVGNACSGNQCCSGLICNGTCQLSTVGRVSGPLNNFSDFLKSIYALLYPIGLGIGAFFILLSGYCFMTSEGNPQNIKACQEQLTGAVAGTLFILLSITLLRVIIGSILGVGSVGF